MKLIFPQISRSFLKKNPPRCLRCHYDIPRPIWDPYGQWPSAYGSNDDTLVNFDEKGKTQAVDSSEQVVRQMTNEFTEFMIFKLNHSSHPRYRWLIFPIDFDVSPYTPVRFKAKRFRPNFRLTSALTKLNTQRIISLISEKQSCFARYSALLTTLLLRCTSVSGVRTQLNELVTHIEPHATARFKYSDRANDPNLIGKLMVQMGLEHTDWNMSFHPDFWDYFEGNLYTSDFVADELLRKVPVSPGKLVQWDRYDTFPYLRYFFEIDPTDASRKTVEWGDICHKWIERAREQIGSTTDQGCQYDIQKQQKTIETRVIEMCLSCHNGQKTGVPKLRLGDKREDSDLKTKIWNRVTQKDDNLRMPPTRALTQRELRALAEYLGRDWSHVHMQ